MKSGQRGLLVGIYRKQRLNRQSKTHQRRTRPSRPATVFHYESLSTLRDSPREPPWTPREIHALIKDHYGVTYHPAHLSRKLREAEISYAKPRPMDPRHPDDAKEILAERLIQALDCQKNNQNRVFCSVILKGQTNSKKNIFY